MDYRAQTRVLLKSAHKILSDCSEENISHLALDLRMALECLIYERVDLYKGEISDKDLATWQPDKLLRTMLEIDPFADKSSTLRTRREGEGMENEPFKHLGTENLLSLKDLKSNYHRLGSYLHTQTAEAIAENKGASFEKKLDRCKKVIGVIEKVLESTLSKSDFRTTVSLNCSNCDSKITRRIPPEEEFAIEAKCLSCVASYEIKPSKENTAVWTPQAHDIDCISSGCKGFKFLWKNELIDGTNWVCEECGREYRLGLSIQYKDEINEESDS